VRAELCVCARAAGSVAEHIPYVKNCYGLINEVVELYSTAAEIGDNLTTILEWAQDIKVLLHIFYVQTLNYTPQHVTKVHR
jgi:hypothetical protein